MAEGDRRNKPYLSAQSIIVLAGYVVGIISAFIYLQVRVSASELLLCNQGKEICAIKEQIKGIPLLDYKVDLILKHFRIEEKK